MNQGEAQRYAYTYFLECSTGQITSSGGIANELPENTSLVSGKRVFETSVDTGQGGPSLTHSVLPMDLTPQSDTTACVRGPEEHKYRNGAQKWALGLKKSDRGTKNNTWPTWNREGSTVGHHVMCVSVSGHGGEGDVRGLVPFLGVLC